MTDLNERIRLSNLIDEAIVEMMKLPQKYADADKELDLERAKQFVIHTEGIAKEREAKVDAAVADMKHAAQLAEKMLGVYHTVVKARMQQLSALQSEMSANKAEANVARYQSE